METASCMSRAMVGIRHAGPSLALSSSMFLVLSFACSQTRLGGWVRRSRAGRDMGCGAAAQAFRVFGVQAVCRGATQGGIGGVGIAIPGAARDRVWARDTECLGRFHQVAIPPIWVVIPPTTVKVDTGCGGTRAIPRGRLAIWGAVQRRSSTLTLQYATVLQL